MIYRFLSSEYALEALQTKRLKLGRPSELNDPADCNPRLINLPDDTKCFYDDKSRNDYFRDVYRDFGILCFSATITEPVIWSHYADSHRGIALGFEFHEERDAKFLYKVDYNEERPVVDYRLAQELRGDTSELGQAKYIKNVIKSGFSSKAPSWNYEQEYRAFVWLGGCKMEGRNYFTHFLSKEVVLGLNCRLSEEDVLRAWGYDSGASPKISRAELDEINHSLKIRSVVSPT